MIRYAVLATLFAAAPLLGQTKEVIEEVEGLLAQQRIALRHAEERTEDIEVLRRLLNKAFGFDHVTSQLPEQMQPYMMGSTTKPLFGLPGGGPFGSSFGSQPAAVAFPVGKHLSQTVGPFDGVYLKGSGVVFTLRVPKEMMQFDHGLCVGSADKNLGLGSSCNYCHNVEKAGHKGVDAAVVNDCAKCHDSGTVTSSTVKPVSDWDRIRADVRGEKLPEMKPVVTDPKKPRAVMCKPGDLRELLTAQLHAHAKNVRNLEKNDWVTVVVTFDEVLGTKASRIPAPTDKPGFTPDELQSLTLADLHLKQGKNGEAIPAYEKGLARYRDPVIRLTFPAAVPAAEVQKAMATHEASLRGMYKSLGTAYLLSHDLERAKAALELATSLKVELATASAEKAKPHLPAKIVLAVCKSDIDRNPKLDEFRKAVSVELVGFPKEPEKK